MITSYYDAIDMVVRSVKLNSGPMPLSTYRSRIRKLLEFGTNYNKNREWLYSLFFERFVFSVETSTNSYHPTLFNERVQQKFENVLLEEGYDDIPSTNPQNSIYFLIQNMTNN